MRPLVADRGARGYKAGRKTGNSMSQAVSRFIDAVRWIAALIVALHHCNNVFVNQADIMKAEHDAPVYVWWFATSYTFAHGAVVVFFVLSGFLVGGAAVNRARAGKAYLRNYLIDRSARIYIVLVPALALSVFLDLVGQRVFAGLGVYEHPVYQAALKLEYIPATLVSLQAIWFPTFGTNAALWSLGMEFWYYVICGLIVAPLCAAYATSARWTAFAIAVVLFITLSLPGSYFLFGGAIWALGALVRIAPRPLMRSKWLALVIWAVAVTIMRLVTRGAIIEAHPLKEIVDSVNALLFANILLTLRFDEGEGFSWCRAKYHAAFSHFAYSLYSIHWPILMWLQAAAAIAFGIGWSQRLATPLHYFVALGALAVVFGLAYVFSRLTEARTDRLRTWLRRKIPGGAAAPARTA